VQKEREEKGKEREDTKRKEAGEKERRLSSTSLRTTKKDSSPKESNDKERDRKERVAELAIQGAPLIPWIDLTIQHKLSSGPQGAVFKVHFVCLFPLLMYNPLLGNLAGT
jgi:hypothetical protein